MASFSGPNGLEIRTTYRKEEQMSYFVTAVNNEWRFINELPDQEATIDLTQTAVSCSPANELSSNPNPS